jgi:toxin-antitoxin system PIN domain toxin
MKIPDVNVLINVAHVGAVQHRRAVDWMADAFDDPAGVGFAWVALLGFVRITTRPGAFTQPMTVASALAIVDHWLSQPGAQVVHPGPRHAGLLGRLLLTAGTAGNLTTDAHLAALAIEHGGTIGTFDRDFARFAGLHFDHLLH